MKRDSLRSLYRETMDAMNPSTDASIESLRWRWARGELREPKVTPEQLMALSDQDEAWATHAFHTLERTGFLNHNYRHFLWNDPSRTQTAKTLDALAGLEAAALLRAQLIDMSKVESELDYRHSEILRMANSGTVLGVVMALQRYFATLVVSFGSQELMSRYAELNKVAVCYAWAHQLQPTDVEDLGDWLVLMPEVIESKDGAEAAHLCQAIKCLPFGAQLPDLAAA